MHTIAKSIIFMAAFCVFVLIDARTIGSNSIVARQQAAYFKASETNNLLGFSVFENGITLQNSDTAGIIDLFFPITGSLLLNGGSITLQRDIAFKTPFSMGSGVINGNSHTIEFPRNVSSIQLPTATLNSPIDLITQENTQANVNSIDWSFDNRYLAVGIAATNLADELLIYYFDGSSITVTASFNFSNQSVNTVSWHPNNYYLAVGNSSSSELYIFNFDPLQSALDVISTADTNVVDAVAWHPSGSYLAVGQSNSNALLLYSVDEDGILGSVITTTLSAVTTVSNNALSWHTTGSYLAVGMYTVPSKVPELAVYQFDGSTLTQNGTVSFGQTVYGVSWRPHANQLITGLTGTTENMRLYNYNAGLGTLSEVMSARVGERYPVYATEWNYTGTTLGVARVNDSSGYDLKIWHYDPTTQTFILATGYDSAQPAQGLSWSSDGQYIAMGDRGNMLYLFDFVLQPLYLNDIQLFFDSDVLLTTTVIFGGLCVFNTGNHSIDVTDGSIEVAAGATLIIEQSELKGVQSQNVYCADNDGTLVLRGVTMNLEGNTTFTLGSLFFKDKVSIAGEYTFSYQTTQTSTIMERSELTLDEGLLFDYSPMNGANNLIAFEANTSKLVLNSSTVHVGLGGLALTDGQMIISQDANLTTEQSEESNEGITFGNEDETHDIKLDIKSGQTLSLTQGRIRYKNIKPASLRFGNLNSSIYLYGDTSLYAYQDIFLDPGFLTLGNYVVLGRVIGKDIFGSLRPQGIYFNVWITP